MSQRGRTTPIRDRSAARDLLRRARELERVHAERVVAELLAVADERGELDDVELSGAAFRLLRDAIGRSRLRDGGEITCELREREGDTTIRCDDGELTLKNLVVVVT